MIVPMASEILRAGDVLALAGTGEAFTAAAEVLKSSGAAPPQSEPGVARNQP